MSALSILAGCNGKDKYTTFREALHVARRMRRNQDLSVVAYHCRFCGYAHVGDDKQVSRHMRIQWRLSKRAVQYANT